MNEQLTDNDESWDEIERFVLGELSEEEAAAFQNKLNEDPALQNATQEARLTILGIEESALQKKMISFHRHTESSQTVSQKQGPIKMKPFFKWSIAASILIAAGITAFLFFSNKNSSENMYALYFKPDPGLVSSMGIANNYTFDRGMIDYKTGKYQEALHQWEPLLSENMNSDTLQYFIASAQMGLNEPEKAISLFEKVITKNGAFQNDAYWYLALAWLKKGDKEKAISFAQKSEHAKKDELVKKLKQ